MRTGKILIALGGFFLVAESLYFVHTNGFHLYPCCTAELVCDIIGVGMVLTGLVKTGKF